MPRSRGSSKEYAADIASPRSRDSSKGYFISAEGMLVADITSMPCSRESSEGAVSAEGMVVADIASVPRSRDSSNDGCSAEGMTVVDIIFKPGSCARNYFSKVANTASMPRRCASKDFSKEADKEMSSMPRDRASSKETTVSAEEMGCRMDSSSKGVASIIDLDTSPCDDTWTEREDHIHVQGVTSSDVLSLDMRLGTLAPLGSNTSTKIVLSPPVRLYSRAAAHEHHYSAMASYVEKRSRVAKGSNYVIDLYQDISTPFYGVVNGCTCDGCIDLKAGTIYKMKCSNCVCHFKSNQKCLSIHQYTLSCREPCGASICPKCYVGGVLVDVH
jgi:hypothetical protein